MTWVKSRILVHTCCLCRRYILKSSARAWSFSGITFVPGPTVWGLPLYYDKWWHHNGAKWKAAAEKIIIVARPTINCQQVQDLSTGLNLCWCTPAPRLLKYKYKRPNKNTNEDSPLALSNTNTKGRRKRQSNKLFRVLFGAWQCCGYFCLYFRIPPLPDGTREYSFTYSVTVVISERNWYKVPKYGALSPWLEP